MNSSSTYRIHPPRDLGTGPRQQRWPGIPATLIPLARHEEVPQSSQIESCRIVNLAGNGAKICCGEPLATDRIWLSFIAERRMIVEAEVLWSDFASAGPDEIIYGVTFQRMLSDSEFGGLIDMLTIAHECKELFAPSIREREASLYALFRGHPPRGARSGSVNSMTAN